MSGQHYEDWELVAYDDANADVVDLAAVATHLGACDECSDSLETLRGVIGMLRDPEVHDVPARRPRAPDPRRIREAREIVRRADMDKRVAEQAFAELMRMPVDDWCGYLAIYRALQTEALIARIVVEARSEYDRCPEDALELLKVATSIANTLTNAIAFVQQHGTVAKERANALRVLSRYQEALAELEWAEQFFIQMPVHFFELALVEWARATVLFYMTRYAEALPLVRRAAKTLRQFGDVPRAEQAALLEAGILFEMGDVAAAFAMNERLAVYFQRIGDTETLARAVANMSACEVLLDHPDAAQGYAARAMLLYEQLGKPTERARVHWTLGSLSMRQGRFTEAHARLTAAAEAFQELGMRAEAGQALLEVVEMYIALQQWAEAVPLARELAGLFMGVGAQVHAARAYGYLREAVEARRATLELVCYVRTYVEAADDECAFAPPAA